MTIQRIVSCVLLAITMAFAVPAKAEPITLREFLSERAIEAPGPWYAPGTEPETSEQRASRLRMIVDVIVTSAPVAAKEYDWFWTPTDLAIAAFTKTYYESGHWDIKIHNGTKKGDHGHSVCLGQIWGGGKKLVGTDRAHTTACIMAVMKHLAFHQHRCLNNTTPINWWSVAQIYSGYGTGWSCKAGIWRAKQNPDGSEMRNPDGSPVKEFWAMNRAHAWDRTEKAWHEQSMGPVVTN